MKNFWLNVAAVVTATGIAATAAALWSLNARVARIESRLGISAVAQLPPPSSQPTLANLVPGPTSCQAQP